MTGSSSVVSTAVMVYSTTASHWPGSKLTVIFAGHESTGTISAVAVTSGLSGAWLASNSLKIMLIQVRPIMATSTEVNTDLNILAFIVICSVTNSVPECSNRGKSQGEVAI